MSYKPGYLAEDSTADPMFDIDSAMDRQAELAEEGRALSGLHADAVARFPGSVGDLRWQELTRPRGFFRALINAIVSF